MATENRSPSYNGVRDFVRNWATTTREGQFARDNIRAWSRGGDASRTFDDDRWTDFEDWYRENKNNLAVAANNQAIRDAHQKGFTPTKTKLKQFCRIPLSYHFRRIAETGDPKYWDDQRNVLREVLENEWFATVPLDVIRAAYEQVMPKGKKIMVYGADGRVAIDTTAEVDAAKEAPAVIPVPMPLSDLPGFGSPAA